MDEDYGASFVTIEDEEGNEFELEYLDTFQFEGEEYMVFLPADMEEDDPDFGYVFLQVVEVDGMDEFATIDDEDLEQRVYEYYMEKIFAEEE